MHPFQACTWLLLSAVWCHLSCMPYVLSPQSAVQAGNQNCTATSASGPLLLLTFCSTRADSETNCIDYLDSQQEAMPMRADLYWCIERKDCLCCLSGHQPSGPGGLVEQETFDCITPSMTAYICVISGSATSVLAYVQMALQTSCQFMLEM